MGKQIDQKYLGSGKGRLAETLRAGRLGDVKIKKKMGLRMVITLLQDIKNNKKEILITKDVIPKVCIMYNGSEREKKTQSEEMLL